MKHEKWISCALGALLAFCLSVAGAFCLITAFNFTAVDTGEVLLWCGLCGCVFSLFYTLKLSLVNWGLLVLAAVLSWRYGGLLDSVQGLLYQLSRIYSMGYGWPVFVGTLEMPLYQDVTAAICAIAALSALFVSRTVCAGKRTVLALLFAVVPLACCLVVTDRVPAGAWLFVFLLGLTLMVLTQTLRRRSGAQANRLTALALIPAVILLGVLFLSFPREGYENQDLGQKLVENVKDWFDDLTGLADPGGPVRADGGAVDLKDVGKRSESMRKIMTVTAQESGTLYLRSCAYDTYYENNWTNLAVECEKLYWPSQELLRSAGEVTVETASTLDMIVFPYYPEEGTLDQVARGISNYTGKKSYSFTWNQISGLYSAYENLDYQPPSTLTQLPSNTYYWAQRVLPNLLVGATSVYSKAQAIGKYVSNSAKYDLDTEKMPAHATDFAQWFIEESDTGYCVHFATAAAVLLRGAGVPARYVTGYLVSVKAGEPTTVYGKNAHAWVEYWLPGVGWVVLEATPAAPLQEQITDGHSSQNVDKPQENTEQTHISERLPPATPKGQNGLWGLWLALAAVAVAALSVIQWRARVAWNRQKRYRGTINRRILTAWGQLAQITRLLGEAPETELYQLAERAKFSGHEMSRSDLAQLTLKLMEVTDCLKRQPFYKRIYYTLILAIY